MNVHPCTGKQILEQEQLSVGSLHVVYNNVLSIKIKKTILLLKSKWYLTSHVLLLFIYIFIVVAVYSWHLNNMCDVSKNW